MNSQLYKNIWPVNEMKENVIDSYLMRFHCNAHDVIINLVTGNSVVHCLKDIN